MRNYVSFRNVQKTYDGDRLIVKNLNLDIREGEFLTLLGPSGSGKTTSLMMLAGLKPRRRAKFCCAMRRCTIFHHTSVTSVWYFRTTPCSHI